ncbi:glutamate ABC transporter substrate-binding protein [Brevibacterium sp.]|uniref:glutamate ABC transporter substrate-binding protein n=1 Tax=Brevibacterium sp. TaxID=1701 RepID=UPI002811FEB9|nr:glutamate ABC transporter substrate-binding protein [Brevibacterium sp.]
MRKTFWRSAIAIGLGLVMLSACGQSGTPNAPGEDAAQAAPEYEVNESADFAESSVWKEAKDSGTLKFGVKLDQPGIGNLEPGSDAPVGFEIELAKMVSAHLGFAPEEIEWVEAAATNREAFLQQGTVDLIAASYTINDERKKVVDFAGPYYIAGQDLLVQEDSDIRGTSDLKGKKACATIGSVPAQRIEKDFPETELVTYDSVSKCLTDLQSGAVDAVTNDDLILRGFAGEGSGLRLVGEPFSEEPLGIGVKKGDEVLRDAVNDALEDAKESGAWQQAFEHAFGSTDGAEAPEIDRY